MVKRNPRAQPPAPAEPLAPAEPPALAEPAPEPVAAAEAAPVTAGWPDVSNVPAGPHCPWCSAVLPSTDLAICPSCGAQLNPADEADVPGVTTIDVKALAWKAGSAPRRNKILSWISGETDDAPDLSGASASAVEPPSLAVRREMLRLELEAEGISLPAELEAAPNSPAPSEPEPEPEPETPGT
jgi:hypothetical protein